MGNKKKSSGWPRPDPEDENSCFVKVWDERGTDSFGRSVPRVKVKVRVTHAEGYGVLVRGARDIGAARAALVRAGYDPDDVAGWGYRPHMADQESVSWPNGLAVGGTPSIAFYF